jgi:subtilisin family serine protease/alpha-tubulin suppressor-like RCC1 family protein
MNSNAFPYDVFLSHSAKDKPVVRPLAERMRQDGLKVPSAFGLRTSDFGFAQPGSFRFRYPLHQERRFIHWRLDDAPIKGSLAQFLYINWHPPDRRTENGVQAPALTANNRRTCMLRTMNNLKAIVGLTLLALACLNGHAAAAQPLPVADTENPLATAAGRPTRVEGELLVKFRGGPKSAAARNSASKFGHKVKQDFEYIGWQHIQLASGMSVEEALARYQQDPDVLAAEPNGFMHATDDTVIPNDPFFSQQWGMAAIGAPFAWAETTGSTNVVAAVIDSGINYNHQDLAANMWHNPGEIPGNGLDDDGNGWVDDVLGIDFVNGDSDPMDESIGGGIYHGTACASIIGGIGNNGLGGAGINWRIQLLAIRVLNTSNTTPISDVVAALNYLLGLKLHGINLKVVNLSLGGTSYSGSQKNAIAALGTAGVVVVAGAGNNSTDNDVTPFYPAAYDAPNIISVAASVEGDQLAGFSNYGVTSVDLAAPGVGIIFASGPGTTNYSQGQGTSYATPFVAGAVALLAAAHPDWTVAEIKAAILDSVDVLPAFQGKVLTAGRLNIGKSLLNARTNQPPLFIVTPKDAEVTPGASLTLRTSCGGTPVITYQWYRDGVMVPGATNTVLPLAGVRSNTAAWVQVGNAFGTTSSPPVTVSVNPLLGPVVAWGANQYGQCDVPGEVTNVAAVAGGRWHSLALRHDGTVVGWGTNSSGQASPPAGLSNVVAIATGTDFSLALRSDGTVVAWGAATVVSSNVPVGLTNVSAIAAGQYHALALHSNGTVTAWGNISSGQSTVPGGLASVMAISGGYQHSVALLSNETVVAWGQNANGEINVPVGLSGVVAIAAGAYATMALKRDGTIVGWGGNNYGQLNIPPGLSNVVAIAGYAHFLALKQDGTVVAWGLDSMPLGVDPNWGQAIVPEGLSNVVAIASNGRHSLALLAPTPPPTLTIQNLGTNAVLHWPVSAAGWQLHSTTNLASAADWGPWPALLSTNQGTVSTSIVLSNGSRFFRLRSP